MTTPKPDDARSKAERLAEVLAKISDPSWHESEEYKDGCRQLGAVVSGAAAMRGETVADVTGSISLVVTDLDGSGPLMLDHMFRAADHLGLRLSLMLMGLDA